MHSDRMENYFKIHILLVSEDDRDTAETVLIARNAKQFDVHLELDTFCRKYRRQRAWVAVTSIYAAHQIRCLRDNAKKTTRKQCFIQRRDKQICRVNDIVRRECLLMTIFSA